MRYIRPKSLTWWAGLLALSTGTGALALPEQGGLADLARLVALLSGSDDTSPAALIALGLGLCVTGSNVASTRRPCPDRSPTVAIGDDGAIAVLPRAIDQQ